MNTIEENQIIEQALSILTSRMIDSESIASPEDTKNFLTVQMAGKQSEIFFVLYLTSQHQVITFEEAFKGTIDGATVYPREIVKAVLAHNAAAVIFAHNHPSGIAEPSEADKRITGRLIAALELIDVRVLDHIIIGGADQFSFAEAGLL